MGSDTGECTFRQKVLLIGQSCLPSTGRLTYTADIRAMLKCQGGTDTLQGCLSAVWDGGDATCSMLAMGLLGIAKATCEGYAGGLGSSLQQGAEGSWSWPVQAQALFLERGVHGQGPRREALHSALSVAMNLTHNNAPGCSAVLAAGGLDTAARLLDAVLGPPEEEAAFVAIADR